MVENFSNHKKNGLGWPIWILLFAIPMLLYPTAISSDWVSNSDVHSLLEFWAAITALIAGSIVLIHFFATGRRFFLMISIGFTLQGAIDLVHAIYSFSRIWPSERTGITDFVPGTYVAGRLILIACILIAVYLEKTASISKNKGREALTFNAIAFLLGILTTVMIINSALPQFILPDNIISRPADFVVGLIYLAGFIAFARLYSYKEYQNPFIWSMAGSLIFGTLTQIYMIHSQQLYDAQFDLSHVLKIISYIFPIFGIAIGTLTMYEQLSITTQKEKKLSANLKNIAKEVFLASEKVSESSAQVASATQQTTASVQQVTSAIQQLSKGAQNQSIKVEETTQIMEQLKNSISQSTKSTQEAAAASSNASKSAQNGTNTVNQAITAMDKIDKATSVTYQTISKLKQRSEQINEIVNIINNVADQTNLLALNAAIEAARAGEAGRGFAVVADEVRKLAENSANSATQIGQLIKETTNETDAAVRNMELSTKEFAQGKNMVTKTGAALEEILSSNQNVATMLQQIAVTSQKISADANHVIKSGEDVATISQEASSSTQQAHISMQQMASTMQEMSSSAQSLAKMGVNLNELVSEFELDRNNNNAHSPEKSKSTESALNKRLSEARKKMIQEKQKKLNKRN